jgi:ribose 1,5-bisphosphokinase PhnN
MTADVALLVGASASGKSRLIAAIQQISRESGALTGIRVVQRLTTRAARESESLPGENRYLTSEEFAAGVASGNIDVHWRRPLSENHENRYGFTLAPHLTQNGIVILSGNNYLNWTDDPMLQRLRRHNRLMVVRVWAARETRLARLMTRRPALSERELISRMNDVPVRRLPYADHLIPNDPQFEGTSPWDLLRLLATFRFSSHGESNPGADPSTSIARGA